VNKADIYPEGTGEIEAYCREHGIRLAGHIPFDMAVTEAMVQGEPVTSYRPEAPASGALRDVWACVIGVLEEMPG
jgi:MinD superfamily P-loop ATPase